MVKCKMFEKALKRLWIDEGVDFGEAFKQAMRELASQSKE
jgi:hypothetical protein